MYSHSFNLRDPKSKEAATIFLYVTFNGIRVKISTREKIIPLLWNQVQKRTTKSLLKIEKYEKVHPGLRLKLMSLQIRLDEISNEVSKYFLQISTNGFLPDRDHLKEHMKRFLQPNNHTLIFNDSVTGFIGQFILEADAGFRKKSNGMNYKKASIVCFKNLFNTIQRYESDIGIRLKWQRFNKGDYSAFIKWHEDKGYSTNYVGRHLKDLKSLMRLAFDEKIHSNTVFKARWFSVPKEVNKKIPLSMNEVNLFLELNLSHNKKLKLSRDIFILGCFTGLRVSDLKQISPDKIYSDIHGVYIKIKTIKTGAIVEVPLNSQARIILSEYNNSFPEFAEQVVNRHIKLLASEIGMRVDRAQKLSIHYSRATFAKIAYELGIPSLHIMKVTGHTSEKSFLRYINVAPDEAVREFRKHDFFC